MVLLDAVISPSSPFTDLTWPKRMEPMMGRSLTPTQNSSKPTWSNCNSFQGEDEVEFIEVPDRAVKLGTHAGAEKTVFKGAVSAGNHAARIRCQFSKSAAFGPVDGVDLGPAADVEDIVLARIAEDQTVLPEGAQGHLAAGLEALARSLHFCRHCVRR